jgi:hypothetical protein
MFVPMIGRGGDRRRAFALAVAMSSEGHWRALLAVHRGRQDLGDRLGPRPRLAVEIVRHPLGDAKRERRSDV